MNCCRRQYRQNGGQCGVCGDPWDEPPPRANENGGTFDFGIISRIYKIGKTITAKVDITANHRGWFEFRLCPNDEPTVQVTHECLDQYLLELADGSGTRWEVSSDEKRLFEIQLRLPSFLRCEHCVFQWKYHAGNTWGTREQEEFYGCADIQITDDDAKLTVSSTIATGVTTSTFPITSSTTTASALLETDSAAIEPLSSKPTSKQCVGLPPYDRNIAINEWCTDQCNKIPMYCPPTMCICEY
ncbi:uncharacterized protein LOC106178104 [Lingula anatina]|uniref:Uncharacterized protein LOC106178104 n=1 Tax=Lingula anatina TaxID=7574 RepID=A0A1S3K2W6_LINAN|nr:uncharacterized protein LOC106178104 [Lingula anatina]|eukprot:XP_013416596.1 uncharacterized protein LOC106178104 [Lingula anatina]